MLYITWTLSRQCICDFFLFMDTATTEIDSYWHTLTLHDALPIYHDGRALARAREGDARVRGARPNARGARGEHRFDHDPDIEGLEKHARRLRVDEVRHADEADQPDEEGDIHVGRVYRDGEWEGKGVENRGDRVGSWK